MNDHVLEVLHRDVAESLRRLHFAFYFVPLLGMLRGEVYFKEIIKHYSLIVVDLAPSVDVHLPIKRHSGVMASGLGGIDSLHQFKAH